MDTALPQKFPFILDRNLAKANCTGNRVCTSCDIVYLWYYPESAMTYCITFKNASIYPFTSHCRLCSTFHHNFDFKCEASIEKIPMSAASMSRYRIFNVFVNDK